MPVPHHGHVALRRRPPTCVVPSQTSRRETLLARTVRSEDVTSGNDARSCAAVVAGSRSPAASAQRCGTARTVATADALLTREVAVLGLTAELASTADPVVRAALSVDGLVTNATRVAVIVRSADVVAERAAAAIDTSSAVVVDEAAEGLALGREAGRVPGFRLAAGADAL